MFVDSTGRRARLMLSAGIGAGLALVTYMSAVGISLMAGSDAPLTPWTGNATTGDASVNSRRTPAIEQSTGSGGNGNGVGPAGTSPEIRPTSRPQPTGGTRPGAPTPSGSRPPAPAVSTPAPVNSPAPGTAAPSPTPTPTYDPPGNGKSQATPPAKGRTKKPTSAAS